jgi:hypothetical protein
VKPAEINLRQFYNVLRNVPLEPTDPAYVPFLERKPECDPIQSIATAISFSDAASVHLLAGQRGTGKSTELRRLRKLLKDAGAVVFLCDMRDYINLSTPIEISDFLIELMGALSEAVEETYGADPKQESFWARMVKFLNTEIRIDEIKVGVGDTAGKVELKASLRDDPTFRDKLQKGLRGHVARLQKDAHGFAVEVVSMIRKREKDENKPIVLIADSLEQIYGVGAEAQTVYKSVENLFLGHAEALHFPHIHILYTIPPYLTPLSPNLSRSLGGNEICNLPSIHIRGQDGTRDQTGLDIMVEIVAKRIPDWEKVFTPDQINRLALDAGGDIRDFFRLLRQCLVAAHAIGEFPIPDSVVERAETQLRSEMLPIPDEDAAWLKRIAASKRPELKTLQELPHLARFFDSHSVLNYRNGKDWYDIHPLLADYLAERSDL